jgi:hypothetical protein
MTVAVSPGPGAAAAAAPQAQVAKASQRTRIERRALGLLPIALQHNDFARRIMEKVILLRGKFIARLSIM